MMYQEQEKIQVRRRQTERAIQLAMASRWEDAVAANRAIIDLFPNDTDAYNRLGKAFMELGRYNDAKKAYKKAIEIDPTNQIAKKNLDRLTVLAKTKAQQAETGSADPRLFIEEMGKTAVTTLDRPSPDVLPKLNAGDRVDLRPQGTKLAVQTSRGELVGYLEPKLQTRLLKLIEGGNQYAAAVTSLSGNDCRIIIKETYQDPSQVGRPSFPTAIATESLRPYTKERLLRYESESEELERSDEEEADGGRRNDEWEDETVLQEGHVRLNDAAAAEDTDDELEE